MLILGSELVNLPLLSLRTSDQIATTKQAIVNPYNLSVLAYRLKGRSLDKPQDSFLMTEDIREISRIGMIIDDSNEIVARHDVIKLNKVLALGFELLNMPVFDKNGKKIGTVINYTLDTSLFIIFQLVVKRPLMQSWLDPELVIHRSQVNQITAQKIIINNSLTELKQLKELPNPDFINPFKTDKPAEEVN